MAKKEKPAKEAPVEGAEGAEDAAPKKGGKLKLILIVVLAMVLGGAGAFAALKFLGGSGAPEVSEAPAEAAPSAEAPPAAIEAPARADSSATPPPAAAGGEAPPADGAAPPVPVGPQAMKLDPFVVNLNDGNRKSYLKVSMSLEAENQALADEITAKMPQIRDSILLLLSSLSADDVASIEGKMRLRGQILNRSNQVLSSGKVKNLFFSEFVIN